MNSALHLFGERSLTLVAATFPDRGSATRAFHALRTVSPRKLGIALITPSDPRLGRKMEPESNGIWHTLLRSHAWLGLAGALGGLALAALVLAAGWPAALASPRATVALGGVYGVFVGMLAAGLLTLRPDRARVTAQVREASEHGQWSVVTHPVSAHEADVTQDLLTLGGGHVLRSL
ncbi:hypothetical protein [Pelomonas sp. Root1444]|uniref:hypothetical protein n=1 Tax=Pelomonas sp. Root1444 TaxID=1736464 RepID=UPI000ACA0EF3|nr:hypothetical protein [Pelomonas sp. Root1444]